MKLKTIYICQKCYHEVSNWMGQCPSCDSWNSFTEDVINVGKPQGLSQTPRNTKIQASSPISLTQNQSNKNQTQSNTFITKISEFDRVMGGGIISGSLTLLSGEPGIGKSTLTLQIINSIAKENEVLLISAEESISQISSRAIRLGLKENIPAINEYNLETILKTIKSIKPAFVIIDSIQVISSMEIPSNAGSVNQVRYCTERIMEMAKSTNTSVLLIGHVTKNGNLAGPRVMEHLVDTVIQLEGDRFHQFRILRSTKNRYGSTNEVGIFEMNECGLQEVKNPSEQFLEGRKKDAIGSVITVAMEGTRPFLVEVQALVSTTPFGYPKRTSNGFDLNRLQLLIAVLEKYGKLNLQNQDVFINVVGGIKLNEPAADLAVVIAIASSLCKKPVGNCAIYGEVGLSGELRQVSHNDKREQEAKKLGLTNIISSKKLKEITQALKEI